MKTILALLLCMIAVLLASCNADTPQDTTQIQYSGETVYISKIFSLPTENPEGSQIGYFGDDWIATLPYSPTQYFSATDGDSALFFYYPDIDRYYYKPRYVTVSFASGEIEYHDMDARIDENGCFSINMDEPYQFQYTDRETGKEYTEYIRDYREIYNYASNASGHMAVLYSVYKRGVKEN